MILHLVELGLTITRDGVRIDRRRGQAVDVSGTLYVDEFDGRLLKRADGWHETIRGALLEAAGRLDASSERLREQAARLRMEADL